MAVFYCDKKCKKEFEIICTTFVDIDKYLEYYFECPTCGQVYMLFL